MELNQHERDSFAAFDDFGEDAPSQEIDLSPIETRAIENTNADDPPPSRAIEPISINTAQIAAETPAKIKTGFSWTAFVGGLAALTWTGAAIGGPISYYGVEALLRLDPAMQAGLVALAVGPAILFWLSAAAAAEALKARRVATALTRMAQQPGTHLALSNAHTVTVKNEIEALNGAVGSALARLADLEDTARRNAQLFDQALAATRENAEYMAGRLAAERNALIELNGELRCQSDTVAHSISRQVRLMREASKLVKSEIAAAEDVLESHLQSFANSAGVMAEHTAQFHQVADSAASASASLNSTMSNMLDGLGEATRLTDAARQSAEQATLAANETANSVRESTRSAVYEAKRAAQAIRAETEAMQEQAVTTMEKLRDAALAARAASDASQAAADAHASKIEKRLSALASTSGVKAAPRVAPQPVVQPIVQAANEEHDLYAAASAAMARGQSRPAPQPRTVTTSDIRPQRSVGLRGFGGWGNLFPSRDEGPMPKAANEEIDAFALADFGTPRKNPDQVLQADAVELCRTAGVDIDAALSPLDLDQIAQSSRNGASARRQAVTDAAPAAVNRIARHIKRDADARAVASEYRARPDLAKSDDKGEASDLVRAYLLIDAALV
ncbi:MAG: hypothetical protein ABUL73_04015 [Alphaproteobacteria bacterium]